MSYALVTGASKGIGKAIAIELAKRKFDLLLIARSEQLLQSVTEEIQKLYAVQVKYLSLDLSDNNAAEQIYNWCRQNNYQVSILVNNAGYGLCGPFDTASIEELTNMMQLNMTTLVKLCHIFLPMLKKQPKSYILNVSSTTAYQALPGMSVYAASKTFVLSFTRGLKHELKGTSVSVTCLSPGSTDTAFVERARITPKALEAAKKVNMTPEAVAKDGVKKMFAGKAEVISGGLNRLGAFMAWLLPKAMIEKIAGSIYK
ncbi:SDR family oxidoreductase [Cytophagaceae bacterium DM2B3-1]|uniref:SDR family oxidoreductase n=1 Tax=Xanthocytophaga flava TaxID=3048013 RepID=A0ABT7CUW1_9BACT|nr:SDR family oxidoreductase [Xanthocytophaga flavus]MDJ1469207.1 SDR family oxidoreductase [Xanthocytophaga flavus]MDJ1497537.1 SDR family oxidoreductase [Xanthocytophaga flavus]